MAVLGLGLLAPRVTAAESLSVLRELGPVQAAGLVARHKVRRIAAIRAVREAGGPTSDLIREFLAELDRLGASRERRTGTMARQLDGLRRRTASLPVRLMKGVGMAGWYSSELPRDIGDADLWLPTIDDCLRLVAELRDMGYDYEPREMSWLKGDLEGVVFGQFHLRHPDTDRLDMDLHVGPYSICYCGLIRFTASAGGDPWTPLTDEDNLCAVIGNAVGDCVIDAKTINDLVHASDRRIDLDYVARTLAAAEFGGFVNALVDCVQSMCVLRPEQSATLDGMRTEDTTETVPLVGAAGDSPRTRLVTAHTRRMVRRLTGDPVAAERIAADAERAYGTSHQVSLRAAGGAPSRLPELNPWTCVRLAPQPLLRTTMNITERVPVGSSRTLLAADLELLETDVGDLVRHRDDVFLPTVDYVFGEELVRAEPSVGADGFAKDGGVRPG